MLCIVDKAIRDKTTQCRHDFKCLTDGGCPGCGFQDFISNDCILVQMKPENKTCPYTVAFGDVYVCKCPTRCEIYLKYGK